MKKLSKILWGIALIAVGSIFALKAFGVTNVEIFFDGWWTLFIIVPCLVGISGKAGTLPLQRRGKDRDHPAEAQGQRKHTGDQIPKWPLGALGRLLAVQDRREAAAGRPVRDRGAVPRRR